MKMPLEKKDYIPATINWVKARGFTDIKANLADSDTYEVPVGYGRQQDQEAFVPDVTGESANGKSYFEVIMKTDDTRWLISKLKLFDTLVSRNGGKLHLMIPRGHFQFAKSLMDENHITAELIRLT